MKHPLLFLSIFFLFSCTLHAQSEYEKEFFATPYKDTFRNESAVMARQLDEYTYTPYGIYDYKVTVVYRAQYILKDLSAVNNFSTLYKNKELKKYELKQIKPDGKVSVIYEYADKNYPDDGYDRPENDDEEKKKPEEIPLEDLEIGDIIDYRYEFTYTTKTKDYRKFMLKNGKFDKVNAELSNFNPYKYLLYKGKVLESKYPAAISAIAIHVPAELKLLQKSLNCAYGFSVSSSAGRNSYICRSDQLPSFTPEEYSYYFRNHPVVKYALIQTNAEKQTLYPYQFTGEKVSMSDIAALGRKMYSDRKFIPKYLYYLNTAKENKAYEEASLNGFFSAFLKTFTRKDKDKLSKLNKLHEYLTNEDELNPKFFGDMNYAVILARFCDKIGIRYKMMACLHRYDGNWEDVISPWEITWGLYIPDRDRDIFICDYDKKSNIFRRFGSLSGTDVIVFDVNSKDAQVSLVRYPEVGSGENKMVISSEVTIPGSGDFEYAVTSHCTMQGQQKYSINDYIESQFDHEELRTPYSFYGLVNYGELYNFKEFESRDQWIEELKRIDSSYRLYIKEYYQDRMLAYLYDEYHFKEIEIDSQRIDEDGTFKDIEKADYGFKVVFRVKGLLEPGTTDSVLVMNLGRMITEQFSLPGYRTGIRKGDIYLSNLKEFRWNNIVEIPEGYECINLGDFNLNFENEAGRFRSVARIENGKLIFEVEKTYKTHFLSADKWMEMVRFLQTAEAVFSGKLLLGKK